MKVKILETQETKELHDNVLPYMSREAQDQDELFMTAEEFEYWEKVSLELLELRELIKRYRHRYGDEAIDHWLICSDIHVVEPDMVLWTAERELLDMDIDYVLSLSSDNDDD